MRSGRSRDRGPAMLKLRVIPCLDVKDGRVVKGVNFVSLRDAGDPVEQAAVYDAAGADELTFLDITASHERRDTLLDVVSRTAARIFLPLTVGGGVRSPDDIRRLLLAGADKCAINSAAVARPELVGEAATRFGSQCVVVAVDARADRRGGWEVFTHGGRAGPPVPPAAGSRPQAAPAPRAGPPPAPARSCSPAWTGTAPAAASPFPCCARYATRCRCRWWHRAESARSRTLSRAPRPAPPGCWPPACSISARSPWPR